jgi:SAM-dependent methyltransferase
MAESARSRVAAAGVSDRVEVRVMGMHDLSALRGERFDGIYSNLGAINCSPDLDATARACRTLLRPGGKMVVSVIGRLCPWEMVLFGARRRWDRAFVRFRRGPVAVSLLDDIVWTSYYYPREFYRCFADGFDVLSYRGMCILAPPPYVTSAWQQHPRAYALAASIDDHAGGLPLIRNVGDHFLMVMARRNLPGD